MPPNHKKSAPLKGNNSSGAAETKRSNPTAAHDCAALPTAQVTQEHVRFLLQWTLAMRQRLLAARARKERGLGQANPAKPVAIAIGNAEEIRKAAAALDALKHRSLRTRSAGRAILRQHCRRFVALCPSEIQRTRIIGALIARQARGQAPAYIFAMAGGGNTGDDKFATSRRNFEKRKSESGNNAPVQDAHDQPPATPPALPPTQWTGEKPRKRDSKKSPIGGAVDVQQTPPHSVEAEMGVLASILCQASMQPDIAQQTLTEVRGRVAKHHFYVPAHGTIFEVLCDMDDAGKPLDFIALTEELRSRDLLKSVGDARYITDLFTFVPTAANVAYYIEILIENFARREAIADGELLARAAYNAFDEDEFMLLVQSVSSRLQRMHSTASGATTAEDAATEIEKPITELPDVIQGILHKGDKASFGGATKARKTWLLLDIAVSVASGAPWFAGFATRKGKVLYVNFELRKESCRKRIRTICDERQITLEKGMLTVWNLRGRVRDWPRLQQQIRPDEYALIIIDPVYKLLLLVGESMRDENRTGGVATVLDQIDALTERTGAAVAFGAHFAKGSAASKESIDRVSGSGVWARDPDTIVTFTALEDDDCYAVEMTLRDHPPQKPFSVRWEYPVFVTDSTLDPTRLKKPGRPRKHDPKEILDLVDKPMSATEILKLAKEEYGMDGRRVYEALCELKQSGQLKQIEKRGPYERV